MSQLHILIIRLAENHNIKPLDDFADKEVPQQNTVLGQGLVDHTDAIGAVAEPSKLMKIPRGLDSAETIRQDIEDFFRKPYQLQSGTFATTDTATSFSVAFMPSAALNVNTAYKEKLKGIYAFKGDMVFTLQANANRFQSGRYMLCWNPSGGSFSTSTGTTGVLLSNRFSKVQRSQLPHVEIDLNCDTQVQLKIPFTSSETMWSVANTTGFGVGDQGQVFIAPYDALQSPAGSANCRWTLWVHFENIVLSGQTIFQSSEWKPKYKKKSVQRQEEEKNGLGPISSVTTKFSDSMAVLTKIPVLAPFTGTAQWVSDIVGDVAKIWGFSKPLNRAPAQMMQRAIAADFNHVDGVNNFVTLAPTSTQELEPLPGLGSTDHDEMSFAYLLKKPTWIRTDNWPTSTASNTLLFSIDINPALFYIDLSDTTVTTRNMSTVCYIAQFFRYWRGSLVFRFKIVKTEFHSGRLMFVFNPWDIRVGAATASTVTTSNTALRTVVDVREGNEFDIAIPYVAIPNYMTTATSDVMGRLDVIVLDQLVAPANVSTSINILTEVYGGDDLEFADPVPFGRFPYIPTAAQSGEWKPQCGMISEVIGGAKINPSIEHARACMGERINSFRQLVKYNSPLVEASAQSGLTTTTQLTHYPWNWGSATIQAGVAAGSWCYQDVFGHMSSIFALVRGSVNLTLATKNDHKLTAITYASTTPTTNVFTKGTSSTWALTTADLIPTHINDTAKTGYTFVNAPFRCQYPAASTIDTANIQGLSTTKKHCPEDVVEFTIMDTTSDQYILYRSGGDDLSFAQFKSIPPLVVTAPRAT